MGRSVLRCPAKAVKASNRAVSIRIHVSPVDRVVVTSPHRTPAGEEAEEESGKHGGDHGGNDGCGEVRIGGPCGQETIDLGGWGGASRASSRELGAPRPGPDRAAG